MRRIRDAFFRRFGRSPLFRKLHMRLLTAILVLVMPLSLFNVAMVSSSTVHEARHLREMSQNAFALSLDSACLRFTYEVEHPEDRNSSVFDDVSGALTGTIRNMGGCLYIFWKDGNTYAPDADGAWHKDVFDPKSARSTFVWDGEVSGAPVRAVAAFPYFFELRYIPATVWIGVVLSLLLLLCCPLIYRVLKRDILAPMAILETADREFGKDQGYRIPPQSDAISDEYLALFNSFNRMAAEVQASHDKDLHLMEAEMENLRLQINPHMLLSSYNTIYALAESKNYPAIQDYALGMVDYFRFILREGDSLVTVQRELEVTDSFIRMQKIRYPGRFSYVYQVDPECLQARIPPLLIENFVENAVKYAIGPDHPIDIVVSIRKEIRESSQAWLLASVTDNGNGIAPEILEKLKNHEPYYDESGRKHIGITNCFRRMELTYGDRGTIRISSEPGSGTQVFLYIPFVEEENNEAKRENKV